MGKKKKTFMGINPKHKGYCTPMTKKTCTPRRKALAKRLKPTNQDISKVQGFASLAKFDPQDLGIPK